MKERKFRQVDDSSLTNSYDSSFAFLCTSKLVTFELVFLSQITPKIEQHKELSWIKVSFKLNPWKDEIVLTQHTNPIPFPGSAETTPMEEQNSTAVATNETATVLTSDEKIQAACQKHYESLNISLPIETGKQKTIILFFTSFFER